MPHDVGLGPVRGESGPQGSLGPVGVPGPMVHVGSSLPTKTVIEQARDGTEPQPLPGYGSVEESIMAIFRKQHALSGTIEGLNYVERARSYERGTGKQYDGWLRAAEKL